MKRIFSCLLMLCLLFSAFAQAESIGGPIVEPDPEITVDRVYRTLTFNGEENLTHGWIVVDVTITNYSLHTLSVKDDFSGTLVYDGLYEFSAEPVFAISEFEPLVRLSGSMVFKVPKLVLEAESYKLMAMLKVDGEIIPLAMDFDGKTKAVSAPASFDTPEELLVAFIDCLKNADFENLLNFFAYREKGRYLDFERYLQSYGALTYLSGGTVFPGYESYSVINELSFLPASQVSTMLLSLFSEKGANRGTAVIRYRNGTVTGQDYFSGEEMTLDEYVSRLNPERLSGLKLESILRVPINPEERPRQITMRNSLIFGCSDSREYILRVSFEGEFFCLGATVCCFPEGWKIESLTNQTMSQEIGIPGGAFAKEENLDASSFDELIPTWESGEVISENLLKAPEITSEDLSGTWTCDEGTLVFDGKTATSISHEDDYEEQLLFCILEDYLYMFGIDNSSVEVYRLTLNGNTLTLYYDDESLRLSKVK